MFSPHASLVQLVDLMKEWPDLACVPLVTVQKILTSIQSFSDILSPLSILRRIPQKIATDAAEAWNTLLLNCFKQGMFELRFKIQ